MAFKRPALQYQLLRLDHFPILSDAVVHGGQSLAPLTTIYGKA